MDQTVQPAGEMPAPASREHGKVSMRVVNGGVLPRDSNSAANDLHCLLYLVALDRPRIRSSQARRLRLMDSLAGGIASRNAAILARDAHFWDYLQQINLTAYDAEIDEQRARHFINRACAVRGRHQFDRERDAADRFFELIEQPFLQWLKLSDCD